jgi:hypothetical protein
VARSGRFGRQPRSAPSLTNTLVAIAREFQQQRAENIMSAWQKGGMFEGKKATDELVLAFWRDKAKGVSKDDPLYDTYSNAVTQLDYNIHESKMTADYAQGKKTDAQMVQFFRQWAGKVPKNSEFYRVLMRDAGQYMRNAKAKSEAEARRLAEERYTRQQEGTRKQMEAGGEYAIDLLRRLAQSGNATRAIPGLIAAPGSGSDLTEFDISDPAVMMQLMDLVTMGKTKVTPTTGFAYEDSTGGEAGTDEVLFHDDDGKGWTGKAIIQQFQKLDPQFRPGQPFNVDYVTGLLDRQQRGINERIERATKTGHMQDVANLMKSKEYVATLNRQVHAYPVQKLYQEARADYDAVTNDPTASPQAILNAWQKYSGTLTRLSNDPRIETNDAMRSMLAAEAKGEPGSPTLNETFTGLAGGDFSGQAKDSATNAMNIERITQQVNAVKATRDLPPDDPNKVSYTYGVLDGNSNFVPQAGGTVVGAATTEAIRGGGQNAQTTVVDDPRGGAPMTLQVTAVPVYAVAKDPRTGEPIDSTGDMPIAWAYNVPKGGTTVTTYGFQTKDSGFVFSSNPPWADGLTPKGASKDGQSRLEVDFTPLITAASLGEKDPYTGQYKNPTALDKPTKADGNGLIIRPPSEKGGPSRLAFDPAQLSHASDERDWTGGPDPQTDFHSLTLATLMRDNDGMRILTNLDKHPEFKNQMDLDSNNYAGVQYDPKTGSAIPGTGDQQRLADANRQTMLATNAKNFTDFIAGAARGWQRNQTGSAYADTHNAKPGTAGYAGEDFGKLATDVIKTGSSIFSALGNVFNNGTNNVNRGAEVNPATGFTIKPVGAIKAPVVQVSSTTKTTTGPMGGPTGTYTPPATTQTGSTAPTPKPDSDGKVFVNGKKYYL